MFARVILPLCFGILFYFPLSTGAAEPARLKARVEVSPELGELVALQGNRLVIKGHKESPDKRIAHIIQRLGHSRELSVLKQFEIELRVVKINEKKQPEPGSMPDLLLQVIYIRDQPGLLAAPVPAKWIRLRGKELVQGEAGGAIQNVASADLRFRAYIPDAARKSVACIGQSIQGQYYSAKPPGPAEWNAARRNALNGLNHALQERIGQELIRDAGPREKAGVYLENPFPFPLAVKIERLNPEKGQERLVSLTLPPGEQRHWFQKDRGFRFLEVTIENPSK